MEKKIKFFMHIPKCAGSTLITILNRNMKTERMGFTAKSIKETADKVDCLHGHIDWINIQYIQDFIGKELDIYTMVRNPVDRMISQYYYDKRGKHTDKPFKQWIMTDGFKQRKILEDFLFENRMYKSKMAPVRIGIVEEFDKSLEILKKLWGLTDITYNRQNIRGKDEGQADEEELNLIMDMCFTDIVLYNKLKDQFMKEYQEFKNEQKTE